MKCEVCLLDKSKYTTKLVPLPRDGTTYGVDACPDCYQELKELINDAT